MDKNTFKKQERLCSQKVIEEMFSSGLSTLSFPIKAVYITNSSYADQNVGNQAAFTVPKRLFKRANKRNLLKRRMKEAYRLNKSLIPSGEVISVMFIFIGKEELPYDRIEQAMKKVMKKISQSIITKEGDQ
ncbi:ribonuclease P protein component [Halosquirtibacter xylanolyticus]|uniref:ribonuclease P protein component n=1 Tax=Halosquirtibacter xylanolyticus TaxID=3374599 RepID=UPI0037495D94|nr:ribonuclease P protein component [Prolixibacteraceae bacterium]